MERINQRIEKAGGIVTTADMSSVAEYHRFNRAEKRGELIKLRSGMYASPDLLLDTMLDIDRIIPGGIVCLYNAWSYHKLTTTIPPSFCVAIERKRKIVIPPTLPITLYYWKEEFTSLGVIEAEMSGHKIHITNLERSVCDAVKYRNKIGLDICAEIVRTYLRKEDRNLSLLVEYAKRLRVFTTFKNYLEIALE